MYARRRTCRYVRAYVVVTAKVGGQSNVAATGAQVPGHLLPHNPCKRIPDVCTETTAKALVLDRLLRTN